GRRRRRARYPRMAVDEEVRLLGDGEAAGEGKQQLDVPPLGCDPPGLRFDHIMEAQPETPIDIEPAQGVRLGPAGVEDRENMRYASRAMALQLIDPANRHLERHQLLFAHPRSSIWLDDGHQNIAWLWQICARSVAPVLKCTQS